MVPRSLETLLPIHSSQTPLLYGRNESDGFLRVMWFCVCRHQHHLHHRGSFGQLGAELKPRGALHLERT